MRSWRRVQRFVDLTACSIVRCQQQMVHLLHQRQSLHEQIVANHQQQDALQQMRAAHYRACEVFSRADFFQQRCQLAILSYQTQKLEVELAELNEQKAALQQQVDRVNARKTLLEHKKVKYQHWIKTRKQLDRLRGALHEESQSQERTIMLSITQHVNTKAPTTADSCTGGSHSLAEALDKALSELPRERSVRANKKKPLEELSPALGMTLLQHQPLHLVIGKKVAGLSVKASSVPGSGGADTRQQVLSQPSAMRHAGPTAERDAVNPTVQARQQAIRAEVQPAASTIGVLPQPSIGQHDGQPVTDVSQLLTANAARQANIVQAVVEELPKPAPQSFLPPPAPSVDQQPAPIDATSTEITYTFHSWGNTPASLPSVTVRDAATAGNAPQWQLSASDAGVAQILNEQLAQSGESNRWSVTSTDRDGQSPHQHQYPDDTEEEAI